MMRHPDPVIEKIIDVELVDDVARSPAAAAGADAEWLDDMILVGRMYVGTPEQHTELCEHILADRLTRQLMHRLRARARIATQKGGPRC